MQFEWNEDKAKLNKRKHGVSFREALTSFYDPKQVVFYDIDHSEDEDREILLNSHYFSKTCNTKSRLK
jgi:uncharacterized DUF497 family protein